MHSCVIFIELDHEQLAVANISTNYISIKIANLQQTSILQTITIMIAYLSNHRGIKYYITSLSQTMLNSSLNV